MNKILKAILRPPYYNIIEPLLRWVYPYIYLIFLPKLFKLYWSRRQRSFFNTFGFGALARKDDYIYRAYLEKFPAKRLLDIGCGYGRLFPVYAELNIPEVIGIDVSPYSIAKAKSW